MGLRSLVRSELRSQSSKLAAAIRYSYDRALTTGRFIGSTLISTTRPIGWNGPNRASLSTPSWRRCRVAGAKIAMNSTKEAAEEDKRA